MEDKYNPNSILVSGTGKMGKPLILGIEQDSRYHLLPLAISDDADSFIQIGSQKIGIIPLDERMKIIPQLLNENGPIILVDAVPAPASQANAELYSQFKNLPVIMMSTGITDLSKIHNTLVLPNACLQIMAWEKFIARLEDGLFSDECYSFQIEESHQKTKKDVSGTARKMVPQFNRLGLKFKENQIIFFRDEKNYLSLGIPVNFYSAHGFHYYTINSSKKDDGLLKVFFGQAIDYFVENSLFKNLFHLDPKLVSNKTYCEKSFIWRSHPSNSTDYPTFSFGLKLILTETGTRIEIAHVILGHQPYVQGILDYALPFMQEKCMNGLTGENFTSLQLYDWAMNQ